MSNNKNKEDFEEDSEEDEDSEENENSEEDDLEEFENLKTDSEEADLEEADLEEDKIEKKDEEIYDNNEIKTNTPLVSVSNSENQKKGNKKKKNVLPPSVDTNKQIIVQSITEKKTKKAKKPSTSMKSIQETSKLQDINFKDELDKIKKEIIEEEDELVTEDSEEVDDENDQPDENKGKIQITIIDEHDQKKKCWIDPIKEKIFSLICQGYSRNENKPCYRYVKGYSYDQIKFLDQIIREYGCICGDHSNHIITVDQITDILLKKVPFMKEYNQKFIYMCMTKISIIRVTE